MADIEGRMTTDERKEWQRVPVDRQAECWPGQCTNPLCTECRPETD